MQGPTALDQSPTSEELEAFLPSSQTYDGEKWLAWQKSGSLLAGFHWPACVFGTYWFCYRRPWKAAVCCYIAGVFLGIVLSGLWLALGFLTFRLAIGLGANRYHFAKANSVVAAAKRDSTDPTQQMEYVRNRGGTSDAAVMVLVTVNLFVWLILYILGAWLGAAQ